MIELLYIIISFIFLYVCIRYSIKNLKIKKKTKTDVSGENSSSYDGSSI